MVKIYWVFTFSCLVFPLIKMSIGEILTFNFSNEPSNQVSSEIVDAKLLYSASAKVLEMIICFLDFQETDESPSLIKNPVKDF